jgi:Flp pilus assembly pilin Flp
MPISFTGNTNMEYTLVGALIVLVCIAGLLAVGGSLRDWLTNIKGDMTTQRNAAVAANTQAQTQASTYDSATTPFSNELAQDLSPEARAALGESLSTKLQTLGANGTTKLLSQQLAELARQLLADNKISQSQSNILMQMANQGFQIAQVESMVEDATQQAGGDIEKLKSMRYSYNGESDTAYDLAAKVGFNNHSPTDYANLNILTDTSNAQYEMAGFLNFYNQAQAAGLMDIPEVKASIDSAATQIASTGETVETLLYTTTIRNEGAIPSYDDFKSKLASSATQMNSASICTTGNFSTDGVSCSK